MVVGTEECLTRTSMMTERGAANMTAAATTQVTRISTTGGNLAMVGTGTRREEETISSTRMETETETGTGTGATEGRAGATMNPTTTARKGLTIIAMAMPM